MSAHTASQIVSVVTVQTADRLAAVAVALAVASEALAVRLQKYRHRDDGLRFAPAL